MDNYPTLPNTGFTTPEKVWYVTDARHGKFFGTLAAAKLSASNFRPNNSVAVVEYNLPQGTATVIMDYRSGTCEWCGSMTQRAEVSPWAKTKFDADVICYLCYQGSLTPPPRGVRDSVLHQGDEG